MTFVSLYAVFSLCVLFLCLSLGLIKLFPWFLFCDQSSSPSSFFSCIVSSLAKVLVVFHDERIELRSKESNNVHKVLLFSAEKCSTARKRVNRGKRNIEKYLHTHQILHRNLQRTVFSFQHTLN